jgi:hypothetical protein
VNNGVGAAQQRNCLFLPKNNSREVTNSTINIYPLLNILQNVIFSPVPMLLHMFYYSLIGVAAMCTLRHFHQHSIDFV